MFARIFSSPLRTPVAVTVLLALSACSTLRVGSDFDHRTDFGAYHTFAWLSLGHRRQRVSNPLVPQRVRAAIESNLAQRGYRLAEDASTADFFIDYTIGSRERIDAQSYPVGFRGPWRWGYPYWGEQLSVRQYRAGTLAIDVFDGRTHQPVWHGWAKKDLSESDLDRPEGPIGRAVDAVLAQFPPH